MTSANAVWTDPWRTKLNNSIKFKENLKKKIILYSALPSEKFEFLNSVQPGSVAKKKIYGKNQTPIKYIKYVNLMNN